jgi:formylglycine-generating enzyme required for sulfatase activity
MRVALVVVLMALWLVPSRTDAQTALPSSDPLGWVHIPAGTFTMGCVPTDPRCGTDEHPRHAVTISKPFELMATEVTLGQFQATSSQVDPQPAWSTSPSHPVVSVVWGEAVTFCRTAGARLPTEAEWEYAARGGRADSVYPWGNDAPTDRDGATNGAAFESDAARPVKSFAANGFGLFDMVGNVWEWVADVGGFWDAEPVTDPMGPATGVIRVVRGGAYGDDAVNLRVSNRTPNAADRINVNVGFRCARDISGA